MNPNTDYKAPFLWPHNEGSVEEAGYEFANANNEEFRIEWWRILLKRVAENAADMTIDELERRGWRKH